MKISKTGFINIIRCDRFAALEEIYYNKEDSIVTFSDNMDDLMTAENINKRNMILEEMRKDDDEELTNSNAMDYYYNEVELLTAKAVKHYFEGELIYSSDTFQQASFNTEIDGYEFYCFLDGLLKTDKGIKVFETKATTTRKFLALEVKKESIFIKDEFGILRLKRDLGYDVDKAYENHENKFFDRYSNVGSYVYDLAFQRFVIEGSKGFDKTKDNRYYLAVLNSEYVFDGKYENNKPVYPVEIIEFIDFTEITKKYLEIIEKDIKKAIKRLNEMNANPVELGKHCQVKKSRECKFKDICYKALPENVSILNYLDNHNGFKDGNVKHETYDLLNDGYLHMHDIPKSWLNRPNNVIQYEVVESKTPYYDKGKMLAGIYEIKYPIYHLDFESFPCPLPRFKGEKAYSQSLFQFSIHIEREPGVCDKEKDHYSFLAKDHSDVREELIKEMIDIIKPDGGSVLVYNISFEKSRIKELGEFFPQYKERLTDISNRLFDLIYIVKTNGPFYRDLGYSVEESKKVNFYHEDLGGSYSIKKVLPIFTDLSYKDLEISNGEEAYVAYITFPTLSETEFKKAYNALVLYCQQDTWAMVKIFEEFRKITDLL